MTYIEREAAIGAVAVYGMYSGGRTAYMALMAIPAADVVEVVRCGQCKYGNCTGIEWLCDKHSGHTDRFGEDASYQEYHSKHWFCADGERRENR